MSEQTPPGAKGGSGRGRGLVVRYWWIVGLAIAGVVAALAATFASRDPDGLNSVAIQNGFQGAATKPGISVIPGYVFPGLDGTATTIVAGLIGIAIVFGLVLVVGRALARRRKKRAG